MLGILSTGCGKQGTGCAVGDGCEEGEQETGRKWQMHARQEPFSVGKFMVYGCDPQSSSIIWMHICRETDNEDSNNGEML
jgi:hypothetical protein